jgi:hypothetical protein
MPGNGVAFVFSNCSPENILAFLDKCNILYADFNKMKMRKQNPELNANLRDNLSPG